MGDWWKLGGILVPCDCNNPTSAWRCANFMSEEDGCWLANSWLLWESLLRENGQDFSGRNSVVGQNDRQGWNSAKWENDYTITQYYHILNKIWNGTCRI